MVIGPTSKRLQMLRPKKYETKRWVSREIGRTLLVKYFRSIIYNSCY